jgi:uncharacterized protein
MFGFSFWKLVVLVAVVAVVWFGFRFLQNREQVRRAAAAATARPESRQKDRLGPRAVGETEDLVLCRVCGAYVARTAVGCGRRDCPNA